MHLAAAFIKHARTHIFEVHFLHSRRNVCTMVGDGSAARQMVTSLECRLGCHQLRGLHIVACADEPRMVYELVLEVRCCTIYNPHRYKCQQARWVQHTGVPVTKVSVCFKTAIPANRSAFSGYSCSTVPPWLPCCGCGARGNADPLAEFDLVAAAYHRCNSP